MNLTSAVHKTLNYLLEIKTLYLLIGCHQLSRHKRTFLVCL